LVACFVGIGIYFWKFRKDGEKTVHKEPAAPVDGGEGPGLVCPYCKNKIEDDWSSCPYCGAKLKEDTRMY
jgi:DNA-directed RNA polymerase subunit RPC12/RpoP